MKSSLPFIVPPVAAIAGVIFGYLLAPRAERRARRRKFHDEIIVMIAELLDTDDDGTKYYDGHRRTVLIECAKIRKDISILKRNAFDIASDAFLTLPRTEKQINVNNMIHTLFARDDAPPLAEDNRPVKVKMVKWLQITADCAK